MATVGFSTWVKRVYRKRLFYEQDGACAICGTRIAKLCIDHDHASGYIRGLLCQPCNMGLGFFRDEIKLLARAIIYLEDHNAKPYSEKVGMLSNQYDFAPVWGPDRPRKQGLEGPQS